MGAVTSTDRCRGQAGWRRGAALTAALGLLVATGCSTPPQSADAPAPSARPTQGTGTTPGPSRPPTPRATAAPSPSPPAETSPAETSPADASPPEDEGATSVDAWFTRTTTFARTGETRLSVEPVTVPLDEPTLGVARAAMEVLVSTDPPDPALATLAPPGTRVLGADRDGAVVAVDLSAEVRATPAGAEGEQAFAQQLAHTAAQFDGVEAVRLLVEGKPVTELWGHLDWSEPVAPEPFALSPIVIAEPAWGTPVPPGPLSVRGDAQVNEGTLALQLLGPDGAAVEEAVTTASCGTTCRGTWSHTFDTPLGPGTWTVSAASTDDSDGEGPGPFTTQVQLIVD